MRCTPKRNRRSLQLVSALAVVILGAAVTVGCNSNESSSHHVQLTDFGTGQDTGVSFARSNAEPPRPATKVVAAKPAEKPAATPKPAPQPAEKQPAKPTPTVAKVTPAPEPASQPAPEKPAPKAAASPAPEKVAETKPAAEPKPAPADQVALAPKPAPKPAPAAEGGRPELSGGTGGFAGVIKFKGAAPEPKFLYEKGQAPKDPEVCGAMAIPDQSLVVNTENNGVANVVIYLRKKPKGYKGKPSSEPVIFDQKWCVFLPHTIFVEAGQEMLVKNSDPIVHNTHTNPTRNPGFNSAIAANDQVGVKLLYRRPESVPVKVVCDLHAWMSAYHVVLDHPFAAITDENGEFAIPNLPPGKYEFTIWQEKSGYLDKSHAVTVKGGEYFEEDLEFGSKDFAQFNGPQPKTLTIAATD